MPARANVTPRWLTNEQALEDSAKFLANVKFDGIDEDLTAPKTPWIYYGVSACELHPFCFLTGHAGVLCWSQSCPHASPIPRPGLWSDCF